MKKISEEFSPRVAQTNGVVAGLVPAIPVFTSWTHGTSPRATEEGAKSGTRRRDLLLGLPLLGALALVPRLAQAQASAAEIAELTRIQAYLNSITTLQSRFTQISSDGGVASGMLWLSRPGRMRVEYDAPVPILMVATDDRIWYYDKRLQQVSFFDLKDTPAWFLLQPNVRFGTDITVYGLQSGPGTVSVTVAETQNPQLGRATLVMRSNPLELIKWQIVDAQQKAVTVTLDNPQYGIPLNPALFQWTDPRPPSARQNG